MAGPPLIAFFVLFAASTPVGTLAYMATSRFWYESLRQSEFVSIVAIVGLTIYLRQGSPQSKPVDEPGSEGENGGSRSNASSRDHEGTYR